MTPPTHRMAELLDAIRDLTIDGISPSVRELAARLTFAQPSGMQRLLYKARDRGLIEWEPRRARTLRVVGAERFSAELRGLSTAALDRLLADVAREQDRRNHP